MPQHRPLFALALLTSAALACSSLQEFVRPEQTDGTRAGTPAPATEEAPAPGFFGLASPTPRRIAEVPTPTPFHTVSADDPRAVLDLARPFYYDYFTNPATWFAYDSPASAAYGVRDGALWGLDREPEERAVYWSYTSVQAGNVYAEISATNGDCIGRDSVGMVIRIDPARTPSGYGLELSCDGEARFRRFHDTRAAVDMIEWTPAASAQTGAHATNRLGLWAYQGRFTLFVNGTAVAETTDPQLTWDQGYFALYVRSSRTYDLTASFTDFAYWNIPFLP